MKTSDEEIKRLNQKINSLEKHLKMMQRIRQPMTVHRITAHRITAHRITAHQITRQVITQQGRPLIQRRPLISRQKERSPAFMKAWTQEIRQNFIGIK